MIRWHANTQLHLKHLAASLIYLPSVTNGDQFRGTCANSRHDLPTIDA
jgi:hypothetical protein